MKLRDVGVVGTVVALLLSSGNPGSLTAQTRVSASGGAAADESWTAVRTPWGDPDIQGIWTSGYIETPMERPDKYTGKESLTDEDVAAEEKKMAASQDHSTGGTASTTARKGDTGAYNTIWSGRGREVIRTRRTSLVVDPPDGKIPWKPEVREQVAADTKNTRSGAASSVREDNDLGGDGPEDRPNDRCRGVALPVKYGTAEAGGAHKRIVQTPGVVSIYYEFGPHGGAYRTIPLDGRPHLPSSVRQWLGHAVGRWEGDTLVVDSTNFTNQTFVEGARENLHLTERFTRTGSNLIIYRATIEDPTVFTSPWTIEVPFTKRDEKANQIFETACHEGNYGLTGILAGARALEREKPAQAAQAAKSSRAK